MPQSSATRPWHPIPIVDCGEPLIALPPELLRLLPHPYEALGAPYGAQQSPFVLRRGVVDRLLQAQNTLQSLQPGCRLAIVDGYRPIAVQQFMVTHSIAQCCVEQGVDPQVPSAALARITEQVGRFWAPPSTDRSTPPPHSTGGAVDLTLVDGVGALLAMGERSMRSERCPSRIITPSTPLLIRALRLLTGTKIASCCTRRWPAQGLCATPTSGGTSVWATSYGPGSAGLHRPAMDRSRSEAMPGPAPGRCW